MSKNTLFVQFYFKFKNHGINSYFFDGNQYVNLDKKNFTISSILSNGFSSSYEICKDIGDFHWVYFELCKSIEETLEKNKDIELPITKGTVYISAFFNSHLCQAYIWALKYPEISFIVGGPAADTSKINEKLPSNLTITAESLDKILGESNKWGIDFPQDTTDEAFFGFPVDRNCYWNKCLFCNYTSRYNKIETDFNFINSIPTRKENIVFLYTPSASPNFIKNILPKLKPRDDIEYSFFIRGSNEVCLALEDTFRKSKPKRLTLVPGIEFPSNRMLNWLQKGTSKESILKTIDLIYQYQCRIYTQVLLGFNNLEKNDIKEVHEFLVKLHSITDGRARIKIHNLVCKVNTPIYEMFEEGEPVKFGPFYFGFLPKISNEQKQMNDATRDIIYNTKFYQVNDLYSDHDVKKHEFC